MNKTITNSEEKALEIISHIVRAIEFEQEHQYINAIGHTGDFSSFLRKKAKEALVLFPQSAKWSTIYSILERYPYLDLATRMSITKRIIDSLVDLKGHYENEINTQNYYNQDKTILEPVQVKKKEDKKKTRKY